MVKSKIFYLLLCFIAIGLMSCSESANDIITKAIKARGSLDEQKAVKTVVADIKAINFGFDISMKMTIFLPDKIRMDMNLLGKPITTIINHGKGWMVSDSAMQMMPEDQVKDNQRAVESQMNFFRSELISDRDQSLKISLLEKDTLDGKKVFRIKIMSKDSIEKIVFIDPDTYLQVKTQVSERIQGIKSVSEVYYRNYKQVQGFMVPYLIELKQNGTPSGKMSIINLHFNQPVDTKIFEFQQM